MLAKRTGIASICLLVSLLAFVFAPEGIGAVEDQSATQEVRLPILAYHNISPEAPTEWYVTPEQFAAQMDALLAYGYQAVSLNDYLKFREGSAIPPARPIIITFDDGYQNILTYAVPILQARGMTAAVFILTGFTGDSEQDRRYNTWNSTEPSSPHLIWPEANDLYLAGFEIESHTINHPALSQISLAFAEHEINQSRLDIQEHIPGNPVSFFAYPHGAGAEDPGLRALIQQAGYQAAVGYGPTDGIADPAGSDIWALPRRGIYRENSLDLNPADPWWFFMRRVDPHFPIPNIAIDQIKVFDSSGNQRTRFYPGEAVTVSITASNWDSPVNVIGTLALEDGITTVYNSHTQIPGADVPLFPFPYGRNSGAFTYSWTIPAEAAPGQYYHTFKVYDEHYVLGYHNTVGQALFTVEPAPISLTVNPAELELHGDELRQIVFTVENSGPAAEEMYLTASLSTGLTVTQLTPAGRWKYYPIGSQVKGKDCGSSCITTTYDMVELIEPAFGTGKKTYVMAVKSISGAAQDEWIKIRLAIRLPEGQLTYDWYLREPLSGEVDQQGWPARRIPTSVIRDDVYLPVVVR